MNLHENFKSSILYYVESNNWEYDENDNEITTVYLLSFGFYDCHYMVYVGRKNLDNDLASYAMIEGDSNLMSSFEEFIEDDETWEFVKTKCKEFDSWLKQLEELV